MCWTCAPRPVARRSSSRRQAGVSPRSILRSGGWSACARTGVEAGVVRADALEWEPKHRFDAILLDAPCTATGTVRRHPEVLHRLGARQIAEMAELQAALLARAANWLKPGGTLVYATCSLEREEGEEQAKAGPLQPDPIERSALPAGLDPRPDGWLRTDPGMLADYGGLDGFFIARWRGPDRD